MINMTASCLEPLAVELSAILLAASPDYPMK